MLNSAGLLLFQSHLERHPCVFYVCFFRDFSTKRVARRTFFWRKSEICLPIWTHAKPRIQAYLGTNLKTTIIKEITKSL